MKRSKNHMEKGGLMLLELHPDGLLDRFRVAQMQRRLSHELTPATRIVLVNGASLFYHHVEGLADFLALLEDVEARGAAVALCHIAPNMQAAMDLAEWRDRWPIYVDREAALDALTVKGTDIS
jgi:anti-anti-sigma regulatory factor